MEDKRISRVDSEIALTAFLASVVSAYQPPQFEYSHLIPLVGVLLLFLTLIRRIALFENLGSHSKIMTVSNAILYGATTLCIIYIFYTLSAISLDHLGLVEWLPFLFAHVTLWLGLLYLTFQINVTLDELGNIFANLANQHSGHHVQAISEKAYDHIMQVEPYEKAILWLLFLSTLTTIITGIIALGMNYFLGTSTYKLSLSIGWLIIYAASIVWYSRYGVVGYAEVMNYKWAIRVNTTVIIAGLIMIFTM